MFKAYGRYADFKGRSGRKEYWLFTLWCIIAAAVAICGDVALFGAFATPEDAFTPLYWTVWLANFIPGLAVAVRRLHDIGRTGWWILLGAIPLLGVIVLIVFFVTKGNEGPNAFGPPDGEAAPGLEREPIVT